MKETLKYQGFFFHVLETGFIVKVDFYALFSSGDKCSMQAFIKHTS